MKKVTLLAAAFLFVLGTYAQEGPTTSFESSDGYTIGALSGQGDWLTPSEIQGQVDAGTIAITDEKASDGDFSVKYNTGGLGYVQYMASDSVASGTVDVTFDFYLSSNVSDPDNDVERVFIGSDLGPGMFVQFSAGQVQTINQGVDAGTQDTGLYGTSDPVDITTDQWNSVHVAVDLAQGTADVFVNGNNVASTYFGVIVVQAGSIANVIPCSKAAGVGFVTFGGDEAYLDNIAYSTDLGVEDFETTDFSHYNKNNTLFLNSESQIGNVAVYNLLGQQVALDNINSASGQVDLTALTTGVYIAKVGINGRTKSFKFVKK